MTLMQNLLSLSSIHSFLLQVRHKCKKECLSEQKDCNAKWLYNKTFMDFSSGVHYVICTRKMNFDLS